ncbi:hypothetical protein EC991_009989 [Linnemannia zychae]|nr:hypothetical protein EC991_009989 [Linnemannia zychae]
MKFKILGPVLLLTLANRFVAAAEGDITVDTSNNNKDILDTNFAAAPAAEQAIVTLDSQKAGEALEITVDGVVETTAKVFEVEGEDEEDEDEEDEDEYEDEIARVDEDDDEDDDDEGDEEDVLDEDDEDDIAEEEEVQDQYDALELEGDDFHYADPLTADYDAQTGQCKQTQSQHQQVQQPQEQLEQEQQQITIQKRDKTQEPILSADATAEVGGACIDSFVNFALRFRERCSIKCLKTFTHIFSNPNVLGILDCFGCSNFFVSGFYALGVDCAGLFAAYPKPANATVGAGKGPATTTSTVTTSVAPGATGVPPSKAGIKAKSADDDSSVTAAAEGDYRLGPVKPEDSALPAIDFSTMLKSIGQLTSGDIQDWFDIGADLVKVTGGGKGKDGKAEEGEGSENDEADEATAAASKDLFNKFVSKAASFANWTLTPETLDQTGVFDRVHSLGLF